MKKLTRVLMAALLCAALLLTGCAGGAKPADGGDSEASTPSENVTQAPADTPDASAPENEAEPVGKDAHIRVANLYGLSKLDPHDGWNGWYSCRLGISECLTTVDENVVLQPQLADSWEHPDDRVCRSGRRVRRIYQYRAVRRIP